MSICPSKMHDLLYYAELVIGESSTMASEANMLNTPAILLYPQNYIDMMCGVEKERLDKNLLYVFNHQEIDESIELANKFIFDKSFKDEWIKNNRENLSKKIDVTKYMIDLITNFKN
jgi:hypothetical protein